MKTCPSAGRLGSILWCALVLAAGCSRGSTAGSPQSGTVASGSGDLASTSGIATTSTTTARATGVSAAPTSGRSSAFVTDTAGRPTPGAKPVFTVQTVPTFYCPTNHTLIPTLVAYDDGTVLVPDTLGAYCDPVPKVRVGTIDPAELDRLATGFFGSSEATVDMTTALATDGPNTTVLYRPIDGGARSVRVYALGSEESSESTLMSAEERQAREKLGGLIAAVTAAAEGGSRWVPNRLVVVGGVVSSGVGGPNDGPDARVSRWPIPLTAAVRTAIEARSGGSCGVITDAKQAAAVLRVHGARRTAARWTVEGHERLLAVGVALPGFPAC